MYTIGHSTRQVDELVALLRPHGVAQLVDIRKIPRSRRHPQFNRETLPGSLAPAQIAYVHMGGLGGLRKPRADSPNTGWRNAGFRGYADYMQTPEFTENLAALLAHARAAPTAIMCAEAVPWRCHRSLVSDALTLRGVDVYHILGSGPTARHRLTPFIRVDGGRITYPPDGQERLAL
jgi:uncharacterized protein (DUF488 family)